MRKERGADSRPARSAGHTGGPLHAALVTRPPRLLHARTTGSLLADRQGLRDDRADELRASARARPEPSPLLHRWEGSSGSGATEFHAPERRAHRGPDWRSGIDA